MKKLICIAINILKKLILLAIIILLIGIGLGYLFIEYVATDFKCKKVAVGKDCIYLKYRVYTNDNGKSFISTSKSRFINFSTDYFYENTNCLFYHVKNDTIFINCGEIANPPPKFKSKIVIIQKSLSNPEFTNLYVNFKTLGYERFP